MKKIRKHDAVSEVVGIIILLGISMALFSVLLIFAFSFPFEPSNPSVNLIGSIDQNTIIIEHRGGESLSLNLKIFFRINNTQEVNITARDYLDTSTSNGDDFWDIGEIVSYNVSEQLGIEIIGKNVSVIVTDSVSNSIVMIGIIQNEVSISLFTQVKTIIPYNQEFSPLFITANGDNELDEVTLWYRYSTYGNIWSSYSSFAIDYDSPWGWDFNFPDGVGYYEFYSIGSSNGIIENVPPSADASCYYGHSPEISNPYPANRAVGIDLNPTLGITVSDVDGDLMTIKWYSNYSGSWQILGTNLSVPNGRYNLITNVFSSYSTTYWWYVSVSDGVNIIPSAIFRFSTIGNDLPIIDLIYPNNGLTNVTPLPLCQIWVNDTDGDDLTVYWYENSTGSYILRNTNSGVSANTTLSYTFTQFTNYNTSYYWKIIVNDSKQDNMAWYYFTTEPINTCVDMINPYIVTTFPFTINATGQSNLDNVTLYYRWSDDNVSWNGGINEVKDPVDSNTCDMDASIDKGLETNFPNAQDYVSDGDSMIIQELNQIIVEDESYNYVDALSNSYDPPDIGSHSSFAEMQDLDGIYDTLTESNTTQVAYVSAGTASGSYTGNPTPWYPSGLVLNDLILLQVTLRDDDSPVSIIPPAGFTLLYGPDTSGGYSDQVRQWIYYKFSDGTESGTATVTVTGSNDDRAARMYAFRNVALTDFIEGGEFLTDYDNRVDAPAVTTIGTGRLAVSFVSISDNIGIDSFSGESGGDWGEETEYQFNGDDDICMQLQTAIMTSAGTISGGDDYIGSTERWVVRGFALKPTSTNNYRLDLEVRWTSADYNENNEYLCIYGGTQDSETLQVDVRYSGAWITVIEDIQSGWNNISISSYLTSSTFVIRFVDTNQSNDIIQSSWSVEGVLLHTWSTTTNNQIDFEYQWTEAVNDMVNEQVCIYIASHTGTENLLVNYWTGSTWSQLGTITSTSTGWFNFSALGLTSSIYTIQLKGADESGDSTQDSWNIDVIMLHTWNNTGGTHGHSWIPWINTNNPDTSSPWSWGFSFPDGSGYYEFYSIGKHNGVIEETPIIADAKCKYQV